MATTKKKETPPKGKWTPPWAKAAANKGNEKSTVKSKTKK
jgi:hypothetical protein